MKVFNELVAVVQVGTHKADPPRSGYLDDFHASKEQIVLAELGTLDLMRRAGSKAEPMRALDPAAAETQRIAYQAPIEEALSESVELVLEWLRQAAQRNIVAPPRSLPLLLGMAKEHRPLVWAVLGERGRWLANLEGIVYEEKHFESPEDARDDLENSYDELDTKERVQKLESLGR